VRFFLFLPVLFRGLFLLQIQLLLRREPRLPGFSRFNFVLTTGAIFQRRILFGIYARPGLPGWKVVAAGLIWDRPNLVRRATGPVNIRLTMHR